jgi:hypothetical protein
MQRQLILNNNNIICQMFKEQDFEDVLLFRMIPKQRNTFNSIVSTRKTEGFFKQLTEGHIFNNDNK